MNIERKPGGYWTKEMCCEDALKYKTRTEFQEKSSKAYHTSRVNKWLDDVCSHMIPFSKPRGYWTKERCQEESLKYTTITEFRKKSLSAYHKSFNLKIIDEICSHMIKKLPRGYWTKEKCHEESLKYKTRTEFRKKSSSAYKNSLKLKIIDDVCSHMIQYGDLYKRCIYSYEFSDNCVYVGLTYNLEKRHNNRKTDKKDAVTKHIMITGIQPILKQLTDYIDVKESRIKEGEYVKKYKNEGWIILNKTGTGSVGGDILKWTKDKCQEKALKYNTRSDFRKNDRNVYFTCCDRKWIDDVCSHMIQLRKPNRYWTKERCQYESLKYTSRGEFQKKSVSAYSISSKNKWLDDICIHMD